MNETFDAPLKAIDAAEAFARSLSPRLDDVTRELTDLGMERLEAFSTICLHVMRKLWVEASQAKEASGGTPNPEAFVGVARIATRPVSPMFFRFTVNVPAARPTTPGTGEGE